MTSIIYIGMDVHTTNFTLCCYTADSERSFAVVQTKPDWLSLNFHAIMASKKMEVSYMTFLELAKARYSVRAFKPQAIEEEKLNAILEAGRIAPTACNNQPQKIYVAKSPESRSKLASVCQCTFDAPVILVICYDQTRDWKNRLMPGYESGETDGAIVCTHMMLAAWEQGIGSCWVGWFNADEVAKVLALPKNIRVSALLPIGYAADDAAPSTNHTSYRDYSDTITEL